MLADGVAGNAFVDPQHFPICIGNGPGRLVPGE